MLYQLSYVGSCGIKPNDGDEVKSVDDDDRTWWNAPPMTPQPKDLSGDELAREVARARDLPVRRQAAALLLLELADLVGGDGLFDVDGLSDDVRAVLQPVRMSLL